ncbi:MAG TPA: agmatinase [Saprospiraceae bacterium]|nr:agmatinase [Saprospiraceae bacterium]
MVKLFGIPFDGKSSFMTGAALAPSRIRQEFASPAYNVYSESLIDVHARLLDAGDIHADTFEQLRQKFDALTLDKQPFLFLGGDHSISYLTINKMHSLYGKSFHVLHFDAHGDLYDEFEGDRFSHACPFARIMEENLVLSLTQVGIRAMTPHQREQADRFGVQAFGMQDLPKFEPQNLPGPLYISIDIDVFDPAFAPGVSHQEAGGVDSRQLIQWLQGIKSHVIGADLVEYNPLRDKEQITAALCAKLMKELIQLMIV